MDLISRQAAIEAVNGMPDCPNGFSGTYDKDAIIGILEDVPSVQPQRMRGEVEGIQRRKARLAENGRKSCISNMQ